MNRELSIRYQLKAGTFTRNLDIRERYRRGEKPADIARLYGISRQRVGVIVHKEDKENDCTMPQKQYNPFLVALKRLIALFVWR